MLHAHPRPSRCAPGAALAGLAAVAAGLLIAAPGCELDPAIKENESILAGVFKTPTPVEAAAWAADEFDADKRARGTTLLANAPFGGEPVYVKLYLAHLQDTDANVRAVGALALGMHGSPEHVPNILPLLQDEQRNVRLAAVQALQRLHNPAAIPALIVSVRAPDPRRPDRPAEPDPEVRAEAADALGQYAEPRVLQALISALADDRLTVSHSARRSLNTLTGQDFGEDRSAWLKWLADADDPFAQRQAYTYPYFYRSKNIIEYIPFWPPPPNEIPAQPAGMPPVQPEARGTHN